MAKSFVLLEYLLLFDSNNLWETLPDFEQDLARFLEEKNVEADVVPIAGQPGRKLLILSKKQEIEPLIDNKPKKGK